jgi:Secretion system C-terminal sorting domain
MRMKQLLVLLACSFLSFVSMAQDCERDSSILGTQEIISPPTFSATNPVISTAPACINEPYTQFVTFNVPAQFVFNNIPLSIDSITIEPAGAVSGLPAGLSYSCDPPNCHFAKNTLGCMLISGTPTPNNTPGNYELSINLTVYSLLQIDLAFPGELGVGQQYFITVKNPGECASGVNDLSNEIFALKNTPNPFGQSTVIEVESAVSGQYQFDVFNLLGQRVYNEPIQLVPGTNQFTFDAGDMPNGTYFYSLGNAQGRATKTFVINR